MYELTLYITGQTLRSQRTVMNMRDIFGGVFGDQYSLRIVDVLLNPWLAEDAKILATPALVKSVPPPERRIIGDLSDREKVLMGLGLDEPG